MIQEVIIHEFPDFTVAARVRKWDSMPLSVLVSSDHSVKRILNIIKNDCLLFKLKGEGLEPRLL